MTISLKIPVEHYNFIQVTVTGTAATGRNTCERYQQLSMQPKFNLVELHIPNSWVVNHHRFYEVDVYENPAESDLWEYIQEDLLWLQKGVYHLDLGWYGDHDLNNPKAGYCIHLYRGLSWNNGELLEKYVSKDGQAIQRRIKDLLHAVDNGVFEGLEGYLVDEGDSNNTNDFSDLDNYCIKPAN